MQTECTSKVLYLRKFKRLFTLNLFGNPVSKDEDYSFFIAAYFPKLMFLDYRLLDKTTVSTDSGVFSFKPKLYLSSIIVSLPLIISSHHFLLCKTVELNHTYPCAEKWSIYQIPLCCWGDEMQGAPGAKRRWGWAKPGSWNQITHGIIKFWFVDAVRCSSPLSSQRF